MELAAIAGLVLFLVSETIAYLPIRENGVLQTLLAAGRRAFPKPKAPKSFEDKK